MSQSNTRRILGPLNRVEGDLEITLEVEQDQVAQAWVNSPLFRGFERMLVGKPPMDALVYTPRICGICSVAQSVAAATALADSQGLQPTVNGRLVSNILLACENLADHLSHFYLFFMPDFARSQYANQAWYEDIAMRFRAQTGEASNHVLPARAAFLHVTGVLAGKWPHSLSIQPGGSTKALTRSEQVRVQSIIGAFRRFLEGTLFGDRLEKVAELDSIDALNQWCAQHSQTDFARFLQLAESLNLYQLGRAADRFMSYGAYALEEGHAFRQGLVSLEKNRCNYRPLDAEGIAEDISSSWLGGQAAPLHPFQGQTQPDIDQDGYSWCKAPRLASETFEVGALARQVVNNHPLMKELVSQHGGNVASRVIARLLEFALVVPQMESWCRQLNASNDFCAHADLPKSGQGVGMIEAARGSLGHWLQIDKKRISNYQIIAPTTWNFSPRDHQGLPGPLEQALMGVPVTGAIEDAIAVQHVIRSFDPCMVCTVH